MNFMYWFEDIFGGVTNPGSAPSTTGFATASWASNLPYPLNVYMHGYFAGEFRPSVSDAGMSANVGAEHENGPGASSDPGGEPTAGTVAGRLGSSAGDQAGYEAGSVAG